MTNVAAALTIELLYLWWVVLQLSNGTDPRSSSAPRARAHPRRQCRFVCQAAVARELSYLLLTIWAVLRCEGERANSTERFPAFDRGSVFRATQGRWLYPAVQASDPQFKV